MTHKRVSLGKTARPRLAGVVARPRLFALLDRGREGSIVWVSGPPGCGKTTLCASYLDQAHVPSLWYQLDDGDGDVATFFYYLCLSPRPSTTPPCRSFRGAISSACMRASSRPSRSCSTATRRCRRPRSSTR